MALQSVSVGCLPKLDLLARAHCSTTNSTSTMTEWLVIETQYPTETAATAAASGHGSI